MYMFIPLAKYLILQVAPGYSYTIMLHDKRIISRMTYPHRSYVPVSYLEVDYPKANEIVFAFIRQKMSIAMDKENSPCNDDTEYNLRWTFGLLSK